MNTFQMPLTTLNADRPMAGHEKQERGKNWAVAIRGMRRQVLALRRLCVCQSAMQSIYSLQHKDLFHCTFVACNPKMAWRLLLWIHAWTVPGC
jgi:hypothetical protein